MKKQTIIRLTEQDLHNMIKEAAHRIIKEGWYDPPYDDEPEWPDSLEGEFYEDVEFPANIYDDNYSEDNGEFAGGEPVTKEVKFIAYNGDEWDVADDNDLNYEENEYLINVWIKEPQNLKQLNNDAEYACQEALTDEADRREGEYDDWCDRKGREMRHPELR